MPEAIGQYQLNLWPNPSNATVDPKEKLPSIVQLERANPAMGDLWQRSGHDWIRQLVILVPSIVILRNPQEL